MSDTQGILDSAAERLAAGDLEEAITLWGRILEWEPNNYHANFRIGIAARDLGDVRSAELYLRKADRAEPVNATPLFGLAAVLSDQNRLGEAERTLENAVALEPDDAAGHYRLGVVRHHIAKYEGAAEALERAVALSPDNAEYWYQLAQALEETGTGRAEAGAAHLRAAELNGHDVDAMWSAINWHVEANEFETAEGLVGILLERQGEDNPDPVPQFTLGVILKSAGRIDEARAAFGAALEGCDRVPRVTDRAAFALAAYKARIYHAMDDHDGARRAFRAVGQMIAPAAFEFSSARYLAHMLPLSSECGASFVAATLRCFAMAPRLLPSKITLRRSRSATFAM